MIYVSGEEKIKLWYDFGVLLGQGALIFALWWKSKSHCATSHRRNVFHPCGHPPPPPRSGKNSTGYVIDLQLMGQGADLMWGHQGAAAYSNHLMNGVMATASAMQPAMCFPEGSHARQHFAQNNCPGSCPQMFPLIVKEIAPQAFVMPLLIVNWRRKVQQCCRLTQKSESPRCTLLRSEEVSHPSERRIVS